MKEIITKIDGKVVSRVFTDTGRKPITMKQRKCLVGKGYDEEKVKSWGCFTARMEIGQIKKKEKETQ